MGRLATPASKLDTQPRSAPIGWDKVSKIQSMQVLQASKRVASSSGHKSLCKIQQVGRSGSTPTATSQISGNSQLLFLRSDSDKRIGYGKPRVSLIHPHMRMRRKLNSWGGIQVGMKGRHSLVWTAQLEEIHISTSAWLIEAYEVSLGAPVHILSSCLVVALSLQGTGGAIQRRARGRSTTILATRSAIRHIFSCTGPN